MRVAVGGDDLKRAALRPTAACCAPHAPGVAPGAALGGGIVAHEQQGDVKRAAAEVEDKDVVHARPAMQPVRDRSRRRLLQHARYLCGRRRIDTHTFFAGVRKAREGQGGEGGRGEGGCYGLPSSTFKPAS